MRGAIAEWLERLAAGAEGCGFELSLDRRLGNSLFTQQWRGTLGKVEDN